MIQFDKHIFQMGWFNHQPVLNRLNPGRPHGFASANPVQATALMVMAACHHAEAVTSRSRRHVKSPVRGQ